MDRRSPTASRRPIALAWLLTLGAASLFAALASAGTTGKITGRVADAKKQPLAGVNVMLIGQRLGAMTDADGRFQILNIPAGRYEVRFNLIGYGPKVVKDLDVSPDQTTRLDAELAESALQLQEVVVSAKRPVVEVDRTSTMATVNREQIAKLPVQELQDVVNLQAGVVDGHFRGGRIGEVQYQVDGVSVNNSFDNKSSLRLDRSLLEEVQVISGTFDAEYGQAMSGVVNAVLRRGTEKFNWDAEVYAGGFVFDQGQRGIDQGTHPFGIRNFQFDLSGPSGIGKTLFFASLRRYHFDDYLYGQRVYRPTDQYDKTTGTVIATGDGEEVPLGYSYEWSGALKLTNRDLKHIETNYQAVFNSVDARNTNWNFHLNPDGESRQRSFSLSHGFDWTHTLGASRYYNLTVRQNLVQYEDHVYPSAYDSSYDAAGQAKGYPDISNGVYVQGVDFTRFVQNTDALVVKGAFVDQHTREQQLKVGGEVQWSAVEFGSPEYLVYTTLNGAQTLVRHENDPPKYPLPATYHPLGASGYAQEQIETGDLTLRAGARVDLFDANSTVPSDLANPANSIDGAPPSTPVPTTTKVALSPRIGLSFPISARSGMYFAYGHFYQMPALGIAFSNSDYDVLADLQSSGVSYGVMGNPDIKPERTVQYQGGYKHAVTDDLGIDLTLFYKDIRDLLGVEFVSTYNDATYARFTNVDFGTVIGITAALGWRTAGAFSMNMDYTWQSAQGNSSDPHETATRAAASEDPRPRQIPFEWDQRHTLNIQMQWTRPAEYSVSAIVRAGSGQPYTPAIDAGFGGGLETNSGRKPVSMTVDLRAEKSLETKHVPVSLYMRVFNLFDSRYFNGFVFSNSGSPYYSRYPVADEALLSDPTRYYGPRRIEAGLTFNRP